MPGEEGKKVSGNQKGKKGKDSGGALNPLAAVMAHVPKVNAKRNTKGASHTQAQDTKGASHTQASERMKAANTRSPSKVKKHASHTPVPNLNKVSKEDGVLLSRGAEPALEGEEKDKAQKAKEQMASTLSYLARELSAIGGPLLSDTLDVNHMACYQALDAERSYYLSERSRKEECAFTAVEMW